MSYTVFDARVVYAISFAIVFILVLLFTKGRSRYTVAVAIYYAVFGFLATIPASYINSFLIGFYHFDETVYSYTYAPIVEESCKFILLLVAMKLLKNPRIKPLISPVKGGILVGAGFTVLERNIKLAIAFGIFENIPVHSVTTGLAAFSFLPNYKLSLKRFVPLFAAAIIIHAAFNYASSSAKVLLQIEVLFLVYWLGLIVILLFDRIVASRRGLATAKKE